MKEDSLLIIRIQQILWSLQNDKTMSNYKRRMYINELKTLRWVRETQ